ncbi:histidine phosphatase superfamily [Phyllosticta citriasiana]|uniref:Histidine phosphatase superfamily n=1 Tax=Phyllosticta citriasiana TaxID=595635 RepID=A0ABR1KH74_9PEZI
MSTTSTFTVLSTAACVLVALISVLASRKPEALQSTVPNEDIGSCSISGYYSSSPYSSSWKTWWGHNELASDSAHSTTQRPMQGGSDITQDWNVLYHLGGNGPWVEKVDGVAHGGIAVPDGCAVEQVHMMSRHAERYPTFKAGDRMLQMLNRIAEANVTLRGDLEFVNDWQFISPEPSAHFEQLTTTGPFAGTLGAFTTGVRLRTRYSHLLPPASSDKKTNFWAGDSDRVIDTARYFAAGFFGLDWQDHAQLHIIPETEELGADTLTPGDTCIAYINDTVNGHDKGARMLAEYRATYLKHIRQRLLAKNPNIQFSDAELYSMQELCGFETTVRGRSPWCDVFTKDEWRSFEYARDVIHYYRAGPGNRFGPLMGWLWLNATTNLLVQGPAIGPIFISFVHDGDIIPMLAALDLFHDDEELPVTHRADDRAWRTSQLTPMGGRTIFERLSCQSRSSETGGNAAVDAFVRVNINDGVVAIPGCANGPGGSCPLSDFANRVKDRGAALGNFNDLCGLAPAMPSQITFLRQ